MLRPDAVTSRLRVSFWLEYDNAQENCRPMRMPIVYSGVCHKSYFHNVVQRDPDRMAWILCPPADYILAMREILQEGMEQIRKIVTGNIVSDDGEINTKAAEVLIKAMQLCDLKVYGSPLIKTHTTSESKALHVHTQIDSVKTQAPAPQSTLQAIEILDKKIAQLTSEVTRDLAPPQIVDVSEE